MIEIKNKRNYSGDGVYVGRGRGSVLGNPFPTNNGERTRDQSVDLYHDWLQSQWVKGGAVKNELLRLARFYKRTDHLILICWCAPKRCHSEIIRDAILGIIDKGLV